jgi:RNA polymerase sigma-70 factor (ECF subfamily)
MPLGPDAVVQVLLRDRLRIAAVAVAVVRDIHAADDIFQQVVLSALQHRDQFQDAGHALGWAIRAARHRAVDLARGRHLRPLPDAVLDRLEAAWADPAEACPSDRAEALHRCLAKLTGPVRTLIGLRYDEGLSAAAIGERLGRSTDAVYQTLSRVHRALRACVEQELARSEAPASGVTT